MVGRSFCWCSRPLARGRALSLGWLGVPLCTSSAAAAAARPMILVDPGDRGSARVVRLWLWRMVYG
jgi:hypothetical protein